MGQAQPFQSEPARSIDYLAPLRRLVADLEMGKAADIWSTKIE